MTDTDNHWVFAYGSNMHLEDLLRWHHEHAQPAPVIHATVPATLNGYTLVWNYYSRRRRGGAANVQPEIGKQVPGLALHVDMHTLASLDIKEGRPRTYDRSARRIQLGDGRMLDAWVYEVVPSRCHPEYVPPHRDYLQLLIESAQAYKLPEAHIRWLEQLDTAGP